MVIPSSYLKWWLLNILLKAFSLLAIWLWALCFWNWFVADWFDAPKANKYTFALGPIIYFMTKWLGKYDILSDEEINAMRRL